MNAYWVGGIVRSTFTLAAELARRGYDVEIVSLYRGREEPFFDLDPSVKLRALVDRRAGRSRRDRVPSLVCRVDDFNFSNYSLATDLALIRAMRAIEAGVIVATRPSIVFVAQRFASANVAVVAHEHLHHGAYGSRLRRDIARVYRGANAIVTLTERDAAEYRSALGPQARVVAVPDPVEPHTGPPSDQSSHVIVAAGRLVWQKGFDLLIRAFAPVAAAHPDWELRIHGWGRERDALRRLVDDLSLRDRVRLMGPTPSLGAELATASIYVLSSRSEGFGVVLVEAMSAGLAVVSFDCPAGPREIITDGVDGVLVPPEDVDALTRALHDLIEDRADRVRLGMAASAAAKRYAPERVAAQWDAVLGAQNLRYHRGS